MSNFTPRLALASAALAAILALGACATGTPPSDSYAETTLLNAEAKQSLEARVNAFDRDISRGNMAATVDYLPPKVVDLMIADTGMSREFLSAAVGAMLEGLTAEMRITGRHDINQALVGTTSAGNPYALIPSVARVDVDDQSMTEQGTTLAMIDGGTWYLAGLTDQETVDEIRQAYPEFRSVALPVR